MSDLDTIKAMLARAGIAFECIEPCRDTDGLIALDIKHDGFTHCFTQWKFNNDGQLLVVSAGY